MILTTKAHVHWKSKGKKAKKQIRLISPYLTGKTAESVLGDSVKGSVYTVFDVEIFASGASDIFVFKRLMERGHQLFHLEGLHAKVVIGSDGFATLGSQNITSKGERNLELSALYTDAISVSKVNKIISPWLERAIPITINMIAEMELLIEPLKKQYEEFKHACSVVQNKIDRAAKEARILLEKEDINREQEELRAEIKRAIEAAPISEDWSRGLVKYRAYSVETTLLSETKSLLYWMVNGVPLSLVRLSRYLCVTDTGEIGWARVAQTRISMIGRGVDFSGKVIAECPTWRIEVESRKNYTGDLPKGANMLILVKEHGHPLCIVPMRFALSSYKTYSPRPVLNSSASNALSKQARTWIGENRASFEKQVIYRITRAFKYSSNLLGDDAKFFGKVGSYHVIRIAIIDGNPILVVKSGFWP
ncbi:phosphatidylserine/phosphatidylglycerophosphate/cardiolipin synthase family protein [Pseudomonas sp. 8O]|uniref:phosphatidylserine/phosphatidylglycerophosphate/ cardiolipin synthase family protein n=1 Tax=Pseudomonas sp. 8O TaxID=2653165 RepID=UPI0012F24E77|nr:phosphatidylserine/phosphatidylglycerophosphate/cardiolipin synthase family protein [Pseudomonas sp. 8O]VXB17268.1 conserved hypothetical protein [Pseudomonas sp. 8O]